MLYVCIYLSLKGLKLIGNLIHKFMLKGDSNDKIKSNFEWIFKLE